MRQIIQEDDEYQVQQENGVSFFYRKDYIAKGDMKSEYSLALMWSKRIAEVMIDLKRLEHEVLETREAIEKRNFPMKSTDVEDQTLKEENPNTKKDPLEEFFGPGAVLKDTDAAPICEGVEPPLPPE